MALVIPKGVTDPSRAINVADPSLYVNSGNYDLYTPPTTSVSTGGNFQVTPPLTSPTPSTSTPTLTNTGWIDPATGNPTPVGIGTPTSTNTSQTTGGNTLDTILPAGTQLQVGPGFSNAANQSGGIFTVGSPTTIGTLLKNFGGALTLQQFSSMNPSYAVSGTTTTSQVNSLPASAQATYSINSLYQKYFGRDAKSDELAFWSTQQLINLDTFLQSEYRSAANHAYDGSPILEGTTKSQKDLGYDEDTKKALSLIDEQVRNGTIPIDIAQLFKAVIANYPKDAGFNTTELLNTFNKIKNETIDPHFQELTRLAIQDVQTASNYMQQKERITLESEQAAADAKIREQQGGLESSGMTFTGEGARTLGAQSAYGAVAGEGTIPQYNRLVAQSSLADRQKAYNDLGAEAEKNLGTQGIAGLTLPNYQVLGGITGDITTQKEQDYGAALKNLINTTTLRNQGYSTQNLF